MSDVIATIEKNAREEIRIRWSEYKGVRYLDLRTFIPFDGEMVPTKKGITLRPEQVAEFAGALNAIAEQEVDRRA